MLKLPEDKYPEGYLGWDDPDAIAAWIEYLIVEAERQMQGLQRGPERMDAVIGVVVQTVEIPDVAATLPPGATRVVGRRAIARMVAQMVYSTIVRGLPANLRSPKP